MHIVKFRTLIAAPLAALLIAGCGSFTDIGIGSSTFMLQAVNDAPLPFTLSESGTSRLELTGGAIRTWTNGSFSTTLTHRQTIAGQTSTFTVSCSGAYNVTGVETAFVENTSSGEGCGDSYVGRLADGTLTIEYDAGVQAVFRE